VTRIDKCCLELFSKEASVPSATSLTHNALYFSLPICVLVPILIQTQALHGCLQTSLQMQTMKQAYQKLTCNTHTHTKAAGGTHDFMVISNRV
jgi:hypothetical protein